MRNDFLEMTAGPPEDGLTVKQLLRGKLRFSMHQISRVKYRPEGITLNGDPCWVNAVLHAGDVLRIRLDDPESADPAAGAAGGPAPDVSLPEIPVLYEDGWILIADKPAGTVSHPSHGHHGDSALDILCAKYGRLYLIGRLDKDTSGVLLFAKQLETASALTRARKEGAVRKEYLARVRGYMDPPEGTIDVPIGTAREFPLKMKTDPESGKAAVTRYRTAARGEDETGAEFSVLSVTIEHGRTHQIRVHMSSAGHPLEGDALYGGADPSGRFPGACLHASSLTLTHPWTGAEITVRAAAPRWCAGAADA
ncbi:MAG: RluA family pseudouridine synthase [Lachnospiraceae bacterium]|nr:RluA family pseudouridine synthase [Lachnospiraceae bacterium]